MINVKPLEMPAGKVTNPISVHRLYKIIFQYICFCMLYSLKKLGNHSLTLRARN